MYMVNYFIKKYALCFFQSVKFRYIFVSQRCHTAQILLFTCLVGMHGNFCQISSEHLNYKYGSDMKYLAFI